MLQSINQSVKIKSMSTNNVNQADGVMCHCSGTRQSNIQSLFEQGYDMDAISRWTGALTGCGGCEWDIAQFLKDLAEQQRCPPEIRCS